MLVPDNWPLNIGGEIMSVLLSGWELRQPETLLPVRPGDCRIGRLKTNEVVVSFMCLPSSPLLVHLPGGEEGMSLSAEKPGFVLCGEQWWQGCALARTLLCSTEARRDAPAWFCWGRDSWGWRCWLARLEGSPLSSMISAVRGRNHSSSHRQ